MRILPGLALALLLASPARGHADADPAAAGASDGKDFIADARLFYRVVACGGAAAVPDGLDAATVDAHCVEMAKRYQRFDEKYVKVAQPFFAALRPAGTPTTIVYPFGGGDLASALVTYPDAREITTISLEHAGDPTRLGGLDKRHLRSELGLFRAAINGLLTNNDSTSENMRKLERGGVPGQLSFHLTGLTALGYEPVALRYFTIAPDGTLHYLSQADIDGLAGTKAKRKRGSWVDTDFSEAFSNMELTFRKVGDPSAPLVVHRHISADLSDAKFKGSPLEKHLLAKGKIAAMTKAASYLLWNDGFSGIRTFLTSHMTWMASDATGVPNRIARKAGFQQVTYGSFTAAVLDEADPHIGEEMAKLWSSQPHRKLPFRYGYPDHDKNLHMMITLPAEAR
jgi:hypothetical protein